jgi:hypothetical protein
LKTGQGQRSADPSTSRFWQHCAVSHVDRVVEDERGGHADRNPVLRRYPPTQTAVKGQTSVDASASCETVGTINPAARFRNLQPSLEA